MGPTGDKLIRARILYHGICTPKNQETIQLIETDPRCQIVIATVAFSNGPNANIESFKQVPSTSSVFHLFCNTLVSFFLEKGELNHQESVELARPLFGRKQLLEKWLKENVQGA